MIDSLKKINPYSLNLITFVIMVAVPSSALAICNQTGNKYDCSGSNTVTKVIDGDNITVNTDNTFNTEIAKEVFNITNNRNSANINIEGTSISKNKTSISIYNSLNASDLHIHQHSGSVIKGGAHGIRATNNSITGNTSITVEGTIESTGGSSSIWSGINAIHLKDLVLTQTKDSIISGPLNGITTETDHDGGKTILDISGNITGEEGSGIYSTKFSHSSDLNVIQKSGTISGNKYGIFSDNNGEGSIIITSASKIIGITDDGISANNYSDASKNIDINQNGGSISSNKHGIFINNKGSGYTKVNISANVTGGAGNGIETNTKVGSTPIINLNAGAIVSASSSLAIKDNKGNANVNLNTGSKMIGVVNLGGGDDTIVNKGLWTIENCTGGTNCTTAVTDLGTGNNILTNNADITIKNTTAPGTSNRAVIQAVGASAFSMVNAGAIDMQDGLDNGLLIVEPTATGSFTTSGGLLKFDTQIAGDGAPSDILQVNGNILSTSPTKITITDIGGTAAMTTSPNGGIPLVKYTGSSAANAFTMQDFTKGGFVYRLYHDIDNKMWKLVTFRAAGSVQNIPVLNKVGQLLLALFIIAVGATFRCKKLVAI